MSAAAEILDRLSLDINRRFIDGDPITATIEGVKPKYRVLSLKPVEMGQIMPPPDYTLDGTFPIRSLIRESDKNTEGIKRLFTVLVAPEENMYGIEISASTLNSIGKYCLGEDFGNFYYNEPSVHILRPDGVRSAYSR